MSASARSIDLVCLGRAGVDFYADQIGDRLEDVSSLSKYIGGSSTNIACCSSRMGLSTALITRVGNEHMGQFIREQLQREGVDTRNVVTDPDRLTALVVLGIKDQDTFPLIYIEKPILHVRELNQIIFDQSSFGLLLIDSKRKVSDHCHSYDQQRNT